LPVIWLVAQWLSVLVAAQAGWPHQLVKITVSLLTAWVIIRIAAQLVRDPTWSKLIASAAWTIAALNILGFLDETIDILSELAIEIGGLRISALMVIKAMASLAVLLWLATLLSRFLERRIGTLPNLTPSVQVLFAKLLKIALITIAIVAALSSVGIDLTAFAVFSGAVGVGIGFGLQKIVSNLISGVILLLDRSIKPGDVISVGDTYGWINTLGARYASVVTRDGTEFLIPNEDLITQQVVNWSYSNNEIRLKIPIGVSYNSDVRKARDLCLEAAAEAPRIIGEPKAVCLLKGFGDSSVDFELRIWIADPQNGVSNVKSEVLFRVWDKFHEQGIEIPFPQRDLHLKPPAQIGVWLDGAKGGPGRGLSTAAQHSESEVAA
jgi:small-conductance mechanosensitive channel